MNLLLSNKNFLFVLLGRIVTNIGDSIYYVAAMWLVYELGGNAFYTGLAGFLTMLPKVFQFLFGPFIDRWQAKKILVSTQLLQCLILLIIPFSYLMNLLSVHLILIIMPIVATIEQFSYPTQNKILPLILKKEDLLKGNTYFSFAYQGIDLIFNAIAGILVTLIGAISLFVIDSISFAICALLFSLIKLPNQERRTTFIKNETNLKDAIYKYIKELTEGIKMLFQALLPLLVGAVAINFAIGVTYAILPSLAEEKGGSEIYGYYLTSISTGSLIGVLLASKLSKFKVSKVAIFGFFTATCSWVFSAIIPNTLLSIVLFGLAWIPISCLNIMIGTVNQVIIPNEVLGRVTSASYSFSALSLPVGSLVGGYLASIINVELVFAFTGVGSLLIALMWLLHPKLRKLPKVNEINSSMFNMKVNGKENHMM